ncbi:hypothetical protein DPMN_078761 [Dreissena polymorpha]|uniref:Uncharacterized protein n=1 Tax=Dreissena polymorpha TaxID=45954 RepID=A0A9D3YR35_DREPO|nr:hypothetical protein DPMN_078761 [Dreissena polymorpha]
MLRAGILLNQNKSDCNINKSGCNINELFPPEIEKRRRRLLPIMKQYIGDPINALKFHIVHDNQYIEHKV